MPAGTGARTSVAGSAGTIAVTPLLPTPRPSGGSGSSRQTVTWPTATPGTSVIAFCGPVSYSPIRRPSSRRRGPRGRRSGHGASHSASLQRLGSRPCRPGERACRFPSCGASAACCTSRAARSGSGCRTPATRCRPAREAIRDALVGAGAPVVAGRAACRRRDPRRPRRGPRRVPARRAWEMLGGGRVPGRPRPGSRRAVHLPPPRPARRARAGRPRPRCPRRTGLYAFDTMTPIGPRHLGGRASGGGRRADRRRPRARRRARRLRVHAPAGASRDEERLRRELLPELDRDRRATPSQPGRRHSCDLGRRRPPGKRRAGDLHGTGPTC